MSVTVSRSKIVPHGVARHRRRQQGFTMLEIALALAVIAFALVAIIGILPSGLRVQREAREKTIINEDAQYFINAIKTGSSNLVDLADFVDWVGTSSGSFSNLANAQEVVGLLSRPGTNTAIVRAITGSALERGREGRELAFRYLLGVEVYPTPVPDVAITNFWTLKLDFSWPVTAGGSVGGNHVVYRSQVAANLVNDPPGSPLFFLRP